MGQKEVEKWIQAMPVATLCLYLAFFLFILIIHWKIAAKAGYPGWYGLGMLVPCLNFLLLILFAFSRWPIEGKGKARRKR